MGTISCRAGYLAYCLTKCARIVSLKKGRDGAKHGSLHGFEGRSGVDHYYKLCFIMWWINKFEVY